MVKVHIPLAVALVLAMMSMPSPACEQHKQGHAKTVSIEDKAVAASLATTPAPELSAPVEAAVSVAEPGGRRDCGMRRAGAQTVHLTQ